MLFRLRRHQSPQPIDFVGFHPADGAAGFFQQSREFSFAINLKMPAAEHSQIPSANSAGEKIIAPIRNDQPPPRTQNPPHFAQRLGRTTNIMKHIARNNGIKLPRHKRQLLGPSFAQKNRRRQFSAGDRQHRPRRIHAAQLSGGMIFAKTAKQSAGAAADIQQKIGGR